jgi:UDPglucose--hexose-1-phosphate uridylyltransferase
MLDWNKDPHRRYNPLDREWVLVSPHRTNRPWQGQVETVARQDQPKYDPECYLCPGNARAGGVRNPDYSSTFVFDNDFAALLPSTPDARFDEGGLLVAEAEPGVSRVICFSPHHDLSVPQMDRAALRGVVDAWTAQYQDLGSTPWINHVQIFENRGAVMGASNPHPHGQVWATRSVPDRPLRECQSQGAYLEAHHRCLLCDYLALERERGERIVCENATFTALVPFWAVWPFETMVLARRHIASMSDLTSEERDGLADILKRVTSRYDNVFSAPFPYTMGFHQQPTDGLPHPEWHMHAHYEPPLLRSATVRKFMVGFEMLATPQRDITPETAAARLRDLPETL